MTIDSYLEAIPKAELHVHLEGSMQPETLLMLAERHGVELPAKTPEALRDMYTFRDFEHFIEIYLMISGVLLTQQDLSDLAYAVAANMADQNVRYAEITWSPSTHVKMMSKLPYEAVLDGFNDGRQRAKDEFGIEIRWIPDLVRNMPEYAEEATEWICSQQSRDGGVVALGLGGLEIGFPPEIFKEQFDRARERYAMPSNPHAGETVGAESVWGAVKTLEARRIGHGVRAIEDPELVKFLVEKRIPLEINLTSNLCLNVFSDYASHSLKKLVEAGCIVTINSDDPPLFNTTLTDEYKHAIHDCGLRLDQLEKCALDALRVSYLPDDEKQALLTEFESAYADLRGVHHV